MPPTLLAWAACVAGVAVLSAPLAAQCRPTPPGLVALWDADDIYYVPWHHQTVYAPNIVDRIVGPPFAIDSANPSTAQWRTYISSAVDGRTALLYDPTHPEGPGYYFEAPDHSKLDFTNAMSVELWFRALPNQTFAYWLKHLLCKGGDYYGPSNTGFYLVAGQSGDLHFQVGHGTGSNSDAGAQANVLDGAWHHIVGTFDYSPTSGSGSIRLFVDGTLRSTAGVTLPIQPNNASCVIGKGFGGSLWPTPGWYDEIALYDRALDSGEIAAAYAAGITPMCRPAFPDRRWFDSVAVERRPEPFWSASSMDTEGNVLAMSQSNPNTGVSVVRVYGRSTTTSPWVLEDTLQPPGGGVFPPAFRDMQVSGDTVAAISTGFADAQQRVFAWRRAANSTWTQETNTADPWLQGNGFRSIALAGDLLAAGRDDWYQNGQSEYVQIFRRSGATWTFEDDVEKPYWVGPGSPYPSGGGLYFVEELGYALAIRPGDPATNRPDRVYIAEPGKYDVGVQAGAVHVYEHTGGAWSLTDTITPDEVEPGLASYDGFLFGSHLLVDGSRLLVSAPGRAVYVLEMHASGFTVDGILRPLPGDQEFASRNIPQPMSIEGDLAVVAVGIQNTQGIEDTGGYASTGRQAAHVFARRAGAWTLVSKLRHGYFLEGPFFQSVAFNAGELLSLDTGTRVVRHGGLRDALTSGLDLDPPVVSISSPIAGTIFGATSAFLVGGVTDESSTTVTSSPTGVEATLPAGGGPVSGTVALLEEGENILTLTATDAAGNTGGNSVTVVRDTTRPVIEVLSPVEGAVLGSTPVSFSARVTDLTATTLDFGTNHVPLPESGGVAVGDVDLVEGPNTVTFVATDAAGNVGRAERHVVLDLAAPVVRIDMPLDGSSFGPGESLVAVVANVSDTSATVVASSPAGVETGLPAGGGVASGAVSLQEGFNTIVVTATDQTNRNGSDSIVVLLDTTRPTVAVTSPADGTAVRGVIDFDATALDALPGSGIASVAFAVDGNVVWTDTAAPFESSLDTTSLTEGVHSLSATATDGKGNWASSTVQVRVDNTLPTVAITEPANQAVVGGTIDFRATGSDAGSGVAALTMLVAGAAPQPTDGSTSFVPALATCTASSQVDTRQFADGPLVLSVEALDAAGNAAETTTVTVVVDNNAPERSLLSPSDGAVVHGTIDIVATADDPNLRLLEILVDGVVVGSSPTGQLTVPYDTTSHGDGSMTISVRATDSVGNRSTDDTITVTVDNIGGVDAECDLHPETLNLKSKSQDKAVTLKIEGNGLARLMPTEDHGWELRVPGGSPVPSTAGFAGDDVLVDDDLDGKPELLVKFDRRLLIASIQAGIAVGRIQRNSVLVVEIWADGNKICEDTLRIVQ